MPTDLPFSESRSGSFVSQPTLFHGTYMSLVSKGDSTLRDEDVVELSLLLPGWQAEALARAADGQGLTAGQVVRRLINSFCSNLDDADSQPCDWQLEEFEVQPQL